MERKRRIKKLQKNLKAALTLETRMLDHIAQYSDNVSDDDLKIMVEQLFAAVQIIMKYKKLIKQTRKG